MTSEGLLTNDMPSDYHIENSAANCTIVAAALDERWARYTGGQGGRET